MGLELSTITGDEQAVKAKMLAAGGVQQKQPNKGESGP